MQGGDGLDHLKVKAKEFSFDLTLKGNAPPIFHGKNGIITLANNQGSYYSRPRLKATGSLSVGRKPESVTGVVWFDHQWGDFSFKGTALDWFGLQLADGSDIMIYQVRGQANQPTLANGSITRDGVTELMGQSDFVLTPKEQWLSPKTDTPFPVAWDLKIPGKHIGLTTKSLLKNSEVDARVNNGSIYWLGAITVEGSHSGQGFMRLYR